MSRFWLLVTFILIPTGLAAHGWLENAPKLSRERVNEIVEAVEAIPPGELRSRPTLENSHNFLREVARRLDDPNGEIRRVLFMFDAIRLGHIDATGDPKFGIWIDWEDLIALKDFEAVDENYDRLQIWFQPMIEAQGDD